MSHAEREGLLASNDVLAARRQVLDAIYAITGATTIKVDLVLAEAVERVWDEYDQAVIRQHVILNQGPG